MKNLQKTLESVVISYNQKLAINFVDLDFLVKEFGETELTKDLINDFNNMTPLNFTQVRDLENLMTIK